LPPLASKPVTACDFLCVCHQKIALRDRAKHPTELANVADLRRMAMGIYFLPPNNPAQQHADPK
jgi:hypothetical protein